MVEFKFIEYGTDFGTRDMGQKLRQKLLALIQSSEKVVLDFTGVNVVSNSFADECLAKLLLDMPLDELKRHTTFRGLNPLAERSVLVALQRRYKVITSVEGMQDLLDDEALLKRAMVPGNTNKPVMDNGLESYDIYNLRFVEYNYPVIEAGAGASGTDVYHTYVFGENAYAVMDLASAGIEIKKFGFEAKKGDNLGQIASLGWITMGYGAQVLDPVAATVIYHAVSHPLTRPTDIYAAQD